MDVEHRICYERVVPQAVEAAGLKFWPAGATLRVSFLDGDASVQAKVVQYAQQWTEFANIHFDFLEEPDPKAHIRISFQERGSWSALGKDALNKAYFPEGTPTMNYGWLTVDSPDEDYSVVLHEFGHALGLIHEHQSPGAAVEWDEEAVIADLSGPPNRWNVDMIRRNVLEKYSTTVVSQFTTFDPSSIMVYAIPRHWTQNHVSYPENKVISTTDQEFIRARYPR